LIPGKLSAQQAMRRSTVVVAVGVLIAITSHADPLENTVEDELGHLLNTGGPAEPKQPIAPRLILDRTVAVSPADYTDVVVSHAMEESRFVNARQPVFVKSADGTASWVVADLGLFDMCSKPAGCDRDPPVGRGHVVAVFDHDGKAVAWAIGWSLTASQRTTPDVFARRIDPGTEDAVHEFESTLGDPAAFAKTISDRKDAVLFGSEPTEHYIGGALVRARLAKWRLALKIRDGVQAGLAAKSVAFVAANVDATANGKTTPYRLFAIYEKTDGAWRAVLVQFADVAKPPKP
jgi:hypothetical protein